MLQLVHDGTMAGLLTAVFEAYERKAQDDVSIVRAELAAPDVFSRRIDIDTDAIKARRVWKGLAGKLSVEALDRLWYCYLSELPEADNTILAFVRYVFSNPTRNVAEDYGHPAVLWIAQTARRVWREKHRMEAFVRFHELADSMFYALIEPDFNVLPLIEKHFRSRYADQAWIIYDGRRKWGLSYDQKSETVSEIYLEWTEGGNGMPQDDVLAPEEPLYQMLWKDYFKSTGIAARKNPKLHVRHVPTRYWKYLTEKKL